MAAAGAYLVALWAVGVVLVVEAAFYVLVVWDDGKPAPSRLAFFSLGPFRAVQASPMRLLERWSRRADTGSVNGYYEGMASGARDHPDDLRQRLQKRDRGHRIWWRRRGELMRLNGIVFACMLARIMLLSEITFKLRALTTKKLYGTEDLRILEYPWPNATAGELLARAEQDASLARELFYRRRVEDDQLLRLPPRGGDDHLARGGVEPDSGGEVQAADRVRLEPET